MSAPLIPDSFDFGLNSVNKLAQWLDLAAKTLILGTFAILNWAVGPHRWRPLFSKERWRLQFNNRRLFLFVVVLLWTIALWIGVLYKTFYESVTDFISYFTNIAFAIQAAYYLLYTASFLMDPRKRTLEFFMLFGFWWNVFAQAIIVFVLVFGVFLDAPGIIIGETKTGGGTYDDGLVLFADRFFHVIPAVIALIVLFMSWTDMSDIYILMFSKVYCLPRTYGGESLCVHQRCAFRVDKQQAWTYIGFNFLAAFLPILLYWNIVDIRVVYDLHDFPTYAAMLLVLGINIFAIIIPLMFMINVTIPGRDVPPELVAYDDKHKVMVVPNGVPLPS